MTETEPTDMRSRELTRWLTLNGLAGCICTYLPTGTANWYLYRVIGGCHYGHPDAPPDAPAPYVPRCGPDAPCIDCAQELPEIATHPTLETP